MTYPQTKNYLALKIVSYSTVDVLQRTQLSYAIIQTLSLIMCDCSTTHFNSTLQKFKPILLNIINKHATGLIFDLQHKIETSRTFNLANTNALSIGHPCYLLIHQLCLPILRPYFTTTPANKKPVTRPSKNLLSRSCKNLTPLFGRNVLATLNNGKQHKESQRKKRSATTNILNMIVKKPPESTTRTKPISNLVVTILFLSRTIDQMDAWLKCPHRWTSIPFSFTSAVFL
ncbi:unnamed protein product [Rhizophagus irregularis]|nr:unnamed protein product [Rhizophagus irregularis]